ncbi:alpha-hydroxy acid oxidase [Burkholderia sp. Ac-20353]|uniref:alpha-hydroxy acid oxidase n=1 Tax=Burkholderia sp. Ac-20353 TaxID=2703894 RepID=UPI001F120830|nr:alpha-hydroxy acid oxidase [Burkholderia sp. Ac-20353]
MQDAHSIEDLRKLARRRVPRGVFDFFDGGAEDEITLRENREGFKRISLRPRLLENVENPDISTTILGATAAAPIVIAPTGAIGAGWPKADVAIARTAARLGVPYTLSTTATSSIETIADEAGGRLWFQLYTLRDKAFTGKLLERAAAADYEALVVTLDLATGGKRERDLRNRFTVPFRMSWRTAFDFASRPGWCLQVLRHGQPRFENLVGFEGNRDPRAAIAAKVGQNLDASFDWEALLRLRDRWPRNLLVKGVLRGEDAARLCNLGVDGVWVSNHGGRQLDGAVAAADVLPEIIHALRGRIPVVIDSGVRRGVDIVKALALGASAVAIGRATLYGVTAGGEAGAERALAILTDELRRAMRLCGTACVSDIDSTLVQRKEYWA